MLGSRIEHKQAIENQTAVYFVHIMNFTIFFIHFLPFLLLFGLVANIFKMLFRESEVCLDRCDSYGDFGYLTENQIFLFEEKFIKDHVVLQL